MKWAGRLMTSVAAVLITAGSGLSASAPMASTPADVAWADAIKSDTLEAYAAFVMLYPDSKYAQSAYMKLAVGETASGDTNTAPAGAANFGDNGVPVSRPGFELRTLMII